MESQFVVVPIDGARVVDPETGLILPPEGAAVPRDTFWLRRIMDGSVAEKKTETPQQRTKK